VNVGSVEVSLTVSIQLLDFWGLMLKVLIILGGCFLLTISVAVAYVVYKYRRRQLFFGR
jgi:heme/copper-type cytochrome/quinol oxidase subunit 2